MIRDLPPHTWKVMTAALGFIAFAACLGLLIFLIAGPARAAWQNVAGEWEQYRLNESQKQWFKSVKAKNGVPCCNESDGHPTEMKRAVSSEGANEYWIPNPLDTSVWIKVPDAALTIPPNNPIGVATVWYVVQNGIYLHIRCFVPEGEV